jgi:ABC-type Zn uptake system ZnuABC Zn-binding protein ZnuA
MKHTLTVTLVLFALLALAACSPNAPSAPSSPPPASAGAAAFNVVAVESFLADIAQNVAGERVRVQTLMPVGLDPHSFEPTPQDVIKVADSSVLIVNGAGFEVFLDKLLQNAGGQHLVIDASQGLTMRQIREGELVSEEGHTNRAQGDPHFWLDPINAIKYVENIRDGLSRVDPIGANIYKTNAAAYIQQLNKLDAEIRAQVNSLPPANRKIVTDHDTFGYYADRYGFEIVGMLVPSFSSADAASARQLADLIDRIKSSGVKAIFLDAGTNPQLAHQVAQDTGVVVVTDLYTHSLSDANGPAPTYIDMLKYDTARIVQGLR